MDNSDEEEKEAKNVTFQQKGRKHKVSKLEEEFDIQAEGGSFGGKIDDKKTQKAETGGNQIMIWSKLEELMKFL
jgi:hypothetical protein